jgi:hypothetical protein
MPPRSIRRRRLPSAALLAFALVPAGAAGLVWTAPAATAVGTHQLERLDRGLVSVHSGSGNLVTWRLLGTDPQDVAFNVYRGGTKLNGSPITGATNYLDSGAAASSSYTVRAVVGGSEQAASGASLSFPNGYLDVPISKPASAYTANDASVGDLDGDGQLEIVLKWYPNNAKDNAQAGVTDNTYIDGIKLNGQRLWRINLGRNIRSGAHYTQFQVWDYDGDGKSEVVMKTADGTVDGTGKVIGNASADYRNGDGYILTGPEFLTAFSGQTGAALSTVNYDPPRGNVSGWGDSYGNRVDRFLAGTAYLDGSRPSVIMARGYYTRSVIAAWDFRNGALTKRWTFDSNNNSGYAGQGNHNLSVADVDGDGKDEIIYGAMAVDDNGRPLWNIRTGHGDAMHVGDLIPSRPGLEEFHVSESGSQPADWMADARTGQVLWRHAAAGDNGRGVSADIYAGSPGAESWSSLVAGLSNTSGTNIGRKPGSTNFLSWWDGDATRELQDGTHIDKYGTGGDTRVLTASGVHTGNGTKSNSSLSGDILGDWREEAIWPTSGDTALRIYSTPVATNIRIPTLLHDLQYREALAWQNTAYNQPPHPSFFIGAGMGTPPWPDITTPGNGGGGSTSTTTRSSTTTTTTDGGGGGTTTTTTSRTTTTGGGGTGCAIAYKVTNSWDGGFVADVTVTNRGSAINGWTVSWTYGAGQKLSNAWNGTGSQSGSTVTVKDAGYNAGIAAGGSTTFGLQGTGSAAAPTGLTLNGTSCSAG